MPPKASNSSNRAGKTPSRPVRPLSSQLPTSSSNRGSRANITNSVTGKRGRDDDDVDDSDAEAPPPKRQQAGGKTANKGAAMSLRQQVGGKTARKGPARSQPESDDDDEEEEPTAPRTKGRRSKKRAASDGSGPGEEDTHHTKKRKAPTGRATNPNDDDDRAVSDSGSVSSTGYDNKKPANWDDLPQLEIPVDANLTFKDVHLVVWNLANHEEIVGWTHQDMWNWNFDHFRGNRGGVRRNYRHILTTNIPGAFSSEETKKDPKKDPRWVVQAEIVWEAMDEVFNGRYDKPPNWDRDGSKKTLFLRKKKAQRNNSNGASRSGRGTRAQGRRGGGGSGSSTRGTARGGRARENNSTAQVQNQNQAMTDSAQSVAPRARRQPRKGPEDDPPLPAPRPQQGGKGAGKRNPGSKTESRKYWSRQEDQRRAELAAEGGFEDEREDSEDERGVTPNPEDKPGYSEHQTNSSGLLGKGKGWMAAVGDDVTGGSDKQPISPIHFDNNEWFGVEVGDDVTYSKLEITQKASESIQRRFREQNTKNSNVSSDLESNDPESPTKEDSNEPVGEVWQVTQCGFDKGQEWVAVNKSMYKSLARANRRALRVFRHILDTAGKIVDQEYWPEGTDEWATFKEGAMSREAPFRAQFRHEESGIILGKVVVQKFGVR
jgi:hypothetical protein